MRYVLAILALAISGVLLLLGIGQRTFLEPPTEVIYPLNVEADANYAVIDGQEFARVNGQANVIVSGEVGFAAIGKTIDVEGWLAPFDFARVEIDPAQGGTSVTNERGEKPSHELLEVDDDGFAVPLDPRGSDLWLESHDTAGGTFRMPIALTDAQSLIIAGNGEEAIPAGVSIEWVQTRATPWAGPLLVAGGFFALLGAILYLIAFDRDKRALGPRRGRRGPLLGVRNVVGGSRKRAKATPSTISEGDPKKGSLTSAPALPPGASADEHSENTGPQATVLEDAAPESIEQDELAEPEAKGAEDEK